MCCNRSHADHYGRPAQKIFCHRLLALFFRYCMSVSNIPKDKSLTGVQPYRSADHCQCFILFFTRFECIKHTKREEPYRFCCNPNSADHFVIVLYNCLPGMLAFFGACVVLLVVAVIVWKPRDSIIYPMKRWKPRYRSLGVPPPVPSYIRYDVDNWPDKIA